MATDFESSIRVVDSHTGGEPTRVVIGGGPDLGNGTMRDRLETMRERYDRFRSAIVNEPRGSDVLVGAMLCEPQNDDSAAGTFFFNNVGYLSMCGHGTIGVAVTLAHLGRLSVGTHRFETPPGDVTVTLHDKNRVSVANVDSYRYDKAVSIDVPGIGTVTGDIAWGGNWFFLVSEHGQALELDNVNALTDYAWAIRVALEAAGVRGADGGIIDHVELFGPPRDPEADSRNFVLCPGRAYDRSPCGTGTSAKVACLVEDRRLEPGDTWRQESITGSVFEAVARTSAGGRVRPVITGTAFVTSEATLLIDPDDPFGYGLEG